MEQLPLTLGYARTIHGSQAMTATMIRADLSSCFCPGHVYTALSRVRTLDGLFLDGLDVAGIFAHEDVRRFYGWDNEETQPDHGK